MEKILVEAVVGGWKGFIVLPSGVLKFIDVI
jgi:hypothetical protein